MSANNHDAEAALLGAVLLEPDRTLRFLTDEGARPEIFAGQHIRIAIETAHKLHAAARPVDVLTLADALKATPGPREGWTSFFSACLDACPVWTHAPAYLAIIQKGQRQHRIAELGAQLTQAAASGDTTAIQHVQVELKALHTPEESGDVNLQARLFQITQIKGLSTSERYQQMAAAVLQALHARGRFFFHAEHRDFATAMFFDGERKLLLPIAGDPFLSWLSSHIGINRTERAFQFILASIQDEALTGKTTGLLPATYWAARPGAVYLSNGPGRMARITATGVKIVDNGSDGVLFPLGACLDPWEQVTPVDPFDTCALFRGIAAAAPHGRMLFKLWGIALPTDGKTKPIACLTAPVGGGKTAIVRGIFVLLGIPETVNAVSKNGEGDFWAAIDAGGLVCFDNVDTRVDWLPDALAAAATAGTFTKRRLYTDADRVTLRARASIAVTSANPAFASDAGLSDRLLVIRMKRRTGETAESALFDEVRANRDAGLSWIIATLARALADVAPVPTGLNARHPDFAALAVRIGRAIGREAEAVEALRAAESDKGLFNIENDTIGAALLELLAAGPFTGTAVELLAALTTIEPAFETRLSDKRLGKRLLKLWPHLENTLAAIKDRDGHTRTWIYTFRPPSVAGYAGFGEPFSENSYARDNIETFTKTPFETPQTPHENQFEPVGIEKSHP